VNHEIDAKSEFLVL